MDNKDVEVLIAKDTHYCRRPRNKDGSLDLENSVNRGVKLRQGENPADHITGYYDL